MRAETDGHFAVARRCPTISLHPNATANQAFEARVPDRIEFSQKMTGPIASPQQRIAGRTVRLRQRMRSFLEFRRMDRARSSFLQMCCISAVLNLAGKSAPLKVNLNNTASLWLAGMAVSEGIVSKRLGSRYVSGRTRAWLKTHSARISSGGEGVGHWRRPSSHQWVPNSGWIRVCAGDGSISLNGPMQSTTARLPAISPIIPARRSATDQTGLPESSCRVTTNDSGRLMVVKVGRTTRQLLGAVSTNVW